MEQRLHLIVFCMNILVVVVKVKAENMMLSVHAESMVSVAKQASLLRDRISDEGLLFARNAESVIDCARGCIKETTCSSFTISLDGGCRGHSEVLTSKNMTEQSLGTAYYVILDTFNVFDVDEITTKSAEIKKTVQQGTNGGEGGAWLHSYCTYSCDPTFSACVNHTCLCFLGYYLSELDYTCDHTDCTTMGSFFLEYPQTYILEDEYLTLDDRSYEECQRLCLSNPVCRSFDYKFDTSTCELSKETAFTVSKQVFENVAELGKVSHFQRSCEAV